MIIGITGRKFNGKDTIADHLIVEYGFVGMSFADPLKDMCAIAFGFTEEQLYGNEKEVLDENWGTTPRKILQFVGTELFRNRMSEIIPNIGNEFWCKVMDIKLAKDKGRLIVIPDVRFQNEAELIKKHGGIVIKVIRDMPNQTDAHESEQLTGIVKDHIVYNNGTKDELFKQINDIISNNYSNMFV